MEEIRGAEFSSDCKWIEWKGESESEMNSLKSVDMVVTRVPDVSEHDSCEESRKIVSSEVVSMLTEFALMSITPG